MSTDHADHPRQPAPAGTTSPARPGRPEIVVGLLVMAATTDVLPFFGPLGLELDAVVWAVPRLREIPSGASLRTVNPVARHRARIAAGCADHVCPA
jgi:hypothetical protein